ncbi:MAG: hypothetical protein ACOC8B_08595, partial [Gemmatimonadota bacterium]
MRPQRSRLLERERIAHETLAVGVERPRDFVFRAGQYVELTLTDGIERDGLGIIDRHPNGDYS